MKVFTTVLFSLICLSPTLAHATPSILAQFLATYPNAPQSLTQTQCMICHRTSQCEYDLNPYGTCVETTLKYGSTPNFFAIEGIDSDGDGYTNIQEINAGTQPGDPNSHP